MGLDLRCDFDASELEEDGRETQAAVFALIDDCEVAELPASPATDCTEPPDEDDEDSADDSMQYLRPPKTLVAAMTKEERAARRAERKNLARLKRYHRTREELVTLRRQSVEFEILLKKLRHEEAQHPLPSLKTGPCPFTDDLDDEMSLGEHFSMKLLPRRLPESMDSRAMAILECRKRKRATTVNKTLKRLVRVYQQQRDACINYLETVQNAFKPNVQRPRLPSLPDSQSVEAFSSGGIILLRELYREACLSHQIHPVTLLAQQECGDELAYLNLLGPGIEGGWTHNFTFPGCSSPGEVAAMVQRAMRLETKDSRVLEASFKEHNFLHPLFERKFLWRHFRQSGGLIDLDDIKLSQIFESDDSAVFVWTMSVQSSTRPLFRASGWMMLRRAFSHGSSSPAVVSHSCARVHSYPQEEVQDPQTRESVVQHWASAIRAKQERICNRLLLLV